MRDREFVRRPDHVTSCHATLAAVRGMAEPPRVLNALFPMREQLLVDLLVEWLASKSERFIGTAGVRSRIETVRRRVVDARVRRRPPRRRVVPSGIVRHRAGRAGDRAVLHPVRVGRHRGRRRRRQDAVAGHGRSRLLRRRGRACLRPPPNRPRHRPRRRDVSGARAQTGRTGAPAGGAERSSRRRRDRQFRATGRLGADLAECFTIDVTPVLEQKVAALGGAPFAVRDGARPVSPHDAATSARSGALRRGRDPGGLRCSPCSPRTTRPGPRRRFDIAPRASSDAAFPQFDPDGRFAELRRNEYGRLDAETTCTSTTPAAACTRPARSTPTPSCCAPAARQPALEQPDVAGHDGARQAGPSCGLRVLQRPRRTSTCASSPPTPAPRCGWSARRTASSLAARSP